MDTRIRFLIAGCAVVVALLWSGTIHAADVKFCLKYPSGYEFLDASPHVHLGGNCSSGCPSIDGIPGTRMCNPARCEWDFGEDRGPGNADWSLKRAAAEIRNRHGTIVWSGHTDASGCTGGVNPAGYPFDIYYAPIYDNFATGFEYWVEDCTGSSCFTPLYLFDNVIHLSGTKTLVAPGDAAPLRIFTAATYSLDRLMNNIYPTGGHDFHIEYTGVGDVTNWDPGEGHPFVEISTEGALSKFNVAHEVGHAILLELLQASDPSTVQDCFLGEEGEPYADHTILSQEYSSCAAVEGFAHYMSVATWNNLATNSTGYWVEIAPQPLPPLEHTDSGTARLDIEHGSGELFTYCTGTACCGYGVEMDWARTFWDFRTDSGTKPATMALLDVWDDAYPYPTNSLSCIAGLYDEFLDSIGNELGTTLETRFHDKAAFNGSNY